MAYKLWASGDVLTSSDLNTYLARQVVVVCTSGTRPASPTEGMLIYETDTDVARVYNGSAWKRFGVDLEAVAPVQQTDATALTGITGTSYAAGSPVCGTTFVAPPAGQVFASVSGVLEQANNGEITRLGYEIRTGATIGSGTVVWSASSDRGIACGRAVNTGAAAYLNGTHRMLLGGFTAGSTYNARTMHMVTGGSGAVSGRVITIEPQH